MPLFYKAYFVLLANLVKEIFAAYENCDSPRSEEFAQKKILSLTIIIMKRLQKIKKTFSKQYPAQISLLEALYEAIFSLSLLKNNVSDKTIFSVCETEMRAVSGACQVCLVSLGMKKNIDQFNLSIQILEALFEKTIQFILADPIVFLLFIDRLKYIFSTLHKISDNTRCN